MSAHVALLDHVKKIAKETGTTPEHVARVLSSHVREEAKDNDGTRSPQWPTHRKHWLHGNAKEGIEPHDSCEGCGSKDGVQVHHEVPFEVAPKLELVYSNFVTLCMSVGGLECHLLIGHAGGFHTYNPHVRRDVEAFRKADPERRRRFLAQVHTQALPIPLHHRTK